MSHKVHNIADRIIALVLGLLLAFVRGEPCEAFVLTL